MKQLRSQTGDLLLLDVGDVGTGIAEFADVRVKFYEKAYPYLLYDAVGMGEWEVRYLVESGRSHPYGASVPLLNANVVDAVTGKLLAGEPYLVKTIPGGLRVGIISVVGDHLIPAELQKRLEIRVIPPQEALREHLSKLRKRSDVVILLSHTQLESARKLASEFPELDVVLSGHPNYMVVSADEPKAEKVGNAIVMHATAGGKSLGKLAIEIGADGKISSFVGEQVPMDNNYADDPEIAKFVEEYNADLAEYNQRMWQGRFAAVSRPDAPRDPQPFVTASKCRECHVREFRHWSGTDHARALASLAKDGKANDQDCLACHTTGFGTKGGFESESATPQLANVQCEMCHGTGVRHARNPAKGYGQIMVSTCRVCHDAARSPNFDYKVYLEKVKHPKPVAEPLPASSAK